MCDDLLRQAELDIEHLRDQLAELQGPILAAMTESESSDAYLMYQLSMGSHGRPGICWKHGAVDYTECQIASDWHDYYSCGRTSCDYQSLERKLERQPKPERPTGEHHA